MLNITTSSEDNAVVIFLDGRLDVNAAVEADRTFTEVLSQTDSVVLDLQKLEYVASAGLRAIKKLRFNLKEKGGSLLVRNATAEVMNIFEMTGIAAILKFV